jgi:hypothetical protein
MSVVAGTPQTYIPNSKRLGKGDRYVPPDYLSGSKTIGGKYTAWDTYGQGRPDFGVGEGPGTPYHQDQKTVTAPPPWGPMGTGQTPLPKWAGGLPYRPGSTSNPPSSNVSDPRITAIRKRLGWTIP